MTRSLCVLRRAVIVLTLAACSPPSDPSPAATTTDGGSLSDAHAPRLGHGVVGTIHDGT
jgi:hypothetical protein